MIEEKLQKLNYLKTEHLSPEEVSFLRSHIANTIITHPLRTEIPLYQRAVHHGLRVMLSTFIFMIFVAGSVSVVADNALPGDPLYSFKIGVNEEIRTALLNSSEKKAAYQTDRIDARLNEIKTLAETKTLTKAKQVTVQNALDSHITALSKELDTASTTDALKVTNDLEENLKAQKASLELSIATNATDTEKNEVLQVYDSALMQVSAQEVSIISKEIDALTSDVAGTETSTSVDGTEPTTIPEDTDPTAIPTDTSPEETTATTSNTTPLAP